MQPWHVKHVAGQRRVCRGIPDHTQSHLETGLAACSYVIVVHITCLISVVSEELGQIQTYFGSNPLSPIFLHDQLAQKNQTHCYCYVGTWQNSQSVSSGQHTAGTLPPVVQKKSVELKILWFLATILVVKETTLLYQLCEVDQWCQDRQDQRG